MSAPLPAPRPRNNDVCVDCGGWVSSHTAHALPTPGGTHRTRHHTHLDCTVHPVTEHPLLRARALLPAAPSRTWPVSSVIEATRSGARILLERVTTRTNTDTLTHWEVVAVGGSSATFHDRPQAWRAFARWPRT